MTYNSTRSEKKIHKLRCVRAPRATRTTYLMESSFSFLARLYLSTLTQRCSPELCQCIFRSITENRFLVRITSRLERAGRECQPQVNAGTRTHQFCHGPG